LIRAGLPTGNPANRTWPSPILMRPRGLNLLASALFGRGFAKTKKEDVAGSKSDIAAAQAMKQGCTEHYVYKVFV